MASTTRRNIVFSAAALAALAGCGGGGGSDPAPGPDSGGGTNPSPVVSINTSAKTLLGFLNDTKTLTATAVDAAGATVTNATVTWSSSNVAIATVDSAGKVTPVGVGSADIVATSGTVTAKVPMTVRATPTTVAELAVAFPFVKAGASASIYSDLSQAYTDTTAARQSEAMKSMAAFYSGTSDPLDFFYTTDKALLLNHAARIAGFSAADIAAVVNIVQFPYDTNRVATFVYLESAADTVAVPVLLHENGEYTLDKLVKAGSTGAFTDSFTFGWLREGLGLYWESGTFDAAGAFTPAVKPKADILSSFKASFSQATLETLKVKTYNEITGTAAFAASGVLVTYLQNIYPEKFKQLISEVAANGTISAANGGGTFPMTGVGVMARLCTLIGIPQSQLENDYQTWGLAQ